MSLSHNRFWKSLMNTSKIDQEKRIIFSFGNKYHSVTNDFVVATNNNRYSCSKKILQKYNSKIYKAIKENKNITEYKININDENQEFSEIANLFRGEILKFSPDNIDYLIDVADILELKDLHYHASNFKDLLPQFYELMENDSYQQLIKVQTELLEDIESLPKCDEKILASQLTDAMIAQHEKCDKFIELIHNHNSNLLNEYLKTEFLNRLKNVEQEVFFTELVFIIEKLVSVNIIERNDLIKVLKYLMRTYIINYTEEEFRYIIILLRFVHLFEKTDECDEEGENINDNNDNDDEYFDEEEEENYVDITENYKNLDEMYSDKVFTNERLTVKTVKKIYNRYCECNGRSFLWNHYEEAQGSNSSRDVDNIYANVIRSDDINTFQEILARDSHPNSINQLINCSLFEKRCLCIDQKISLINYAALYSSIKCFKYLYVHKANLTNDIAPFAIYGGNLEIIHICQQNGIDFNNQLLCCIILHRNELFDWIKLNYSVDFSYREDLASHAIHYGNYSLFKAFIEEGVDINGKDNDGMILKAAVQKGNMDLIKFLFTIKGIKMNFKGSSILHIIGKFGNIETFNLLLDDPEIDIKKLGLNRGNNNGDTPLHIACEQGNQKMVEKLLSYSIVDINALNKRNETPFLKAIEGGNLEIIGLFLKNKNVNVSQITNFSENALHYAIRTLNKEIVELILSKKQINFTLENKNWFSPLHLAISREFCVEKLLNERTIKSGNYAINPLFVAIYYPNQNTFIQLLKCNTFDVNDTNKLNLTILQTAILKKMPIYYINLLINQNRLDVNKFHPSTTPPIILSLKMRQYDTALTLLQKPTLNPNVNIFGYTPLSFKHSMPNRLLKTLVKHPKCDIFLGYVHYGYVVTPFSAYLWNMTHFKIFVKYTHCDLNGRNGGPVILLQLLDFKDTKIYNRYQKFCCMVDNEHVNVNITNKDGLTPLHLAVLSQKTKYVVKLLERDDIKPDAITHDIF